MKKIFKVIFSVVIVLTLTGITSCCNKTNDLNGECETTDTVVGVETDTVTSQTFDVETDTTDLEVVEDSVLIDVR